MVLNWLRWVPTPTLGPSPSIIPRIVGPLLEVVVVSLTCKGHLCRAYAAMFWKGAATVACSPCQAPPHTIVTDNWATPPVRLGLSGRNSGRIPERPRKRSQSVSWNSPSRVRLGCPKPYNSRQLGLPEHFQNSLPPKYGWGRLFFQKWFQRGPLRAGHGIPGSTGGISEYHYQTNSPTISPGNQPVKNCQSLYFGSGQDLYSQRHPADPCN